NDLRLLLEHFTHHYADELGVNIQGISAPALRVLLDYDYPGNVRELQNIIERAVTLELTELITQESLPEFLKSREMNLSGSDLFSVPSSGLDLEDVLSNVEKQILESALERSSGNKT